MKMELTARVLGTLTVETVEPTPLYEDGKRVEGEQAANDEGYPLWTISCLYRCEGQRPEIVSVKYASDDEPRFKEGVDLARFPLKCVAYKDRSTGFIRYSLTLPTQGQKTAPKE